MCDEFGVMCEEFVGMGLLAAPHHGLSPQQVLMYVLTKGCVGDAADRMRSLLPQVCRTYLHLPAGQPCPPPPTPSHTSSPDKPLPPSFVPPPPHLPTPNKPTHSSASLLSWRLWRPAP